jgi:hypothetical protein
LSGADALAIAEVNPAAPVTLFGLLQTTGAIPFEAAFDRYALPAV